jgi:hypothetical protein
MRRPGSSVSIVCGYGLDDWAIEVRSPAEATGFFLKPLCPDLLWGPPSLLYKWYRRVLSPRAFRSVTLTTHLHLLTRSRRMSRSYTTTPPPQTLPSRVVGQL